LPQALFSTGLGRVFGLLSVVYILGLSFGLLYQLDLAGTSSALCVTYNTYGEFYPELFILTFGVALGIIQLSRFVRRAHGV
jgi:hypothetical protein